MGGRGTFASGNPVPYTYQTVDTIEGIKILIGKDGQHNLPVEAHNSKAYIRLKPDGTFHEMRFYDREHRLIREIAYHPEPNLNNGNRKDCILHVHDFVIPGSFKTRSDARNLSESEYLQYKKFFRGVKKHDRR